MSDFSPVAWTEGMFLRPQHMQQQERYLHHQYANLLNRITPMAWGVYSLDIDHSLLKIGQFRLNSIECVFPDNTLAVLPQQHPLPEVITVAAGTTDQLIYLVLPVSKTTGQNISAGEQRTITRFHFDDHNIVDTSVGAEAMEVLQVAKLNCRLKLQAEDRAGYVSIAIARIVDVSDEGMIRLDRKFIAPRLSIEHCSVLQSMVSEVLGMTVQRADAIAARLSQTQGNASSIADFLMLQLLNKYQPMLERFLATQGVHPEQVFSTLACFAGELATFSAADKRVTKLPEYQHENLSQGFAALMTVLNQALSSVYEQSAIELPLEKTKFGIYFSSIADKSALDSAEFVLAVKASVPNEELRQRLPSQIKVGSVETIRELVNNQLAGIGVVSLPVAPRQVPYHAGYHYFQLDKSHSLWRSLHSSGGIALHLSGHYPDLDIALWLVNS
ncbi:type VI secretion system baseplate subunit TssK [Shewanella waksmanii]|uniref:type VI secretion system baseplate subunit TssK n=1 Tax=Shewanella waksmanii TaxID=213783 RepID=UPI000491B97F|nr:type VI secretion system baseplate subunit TssK [Shewanella waksmanii]